MRKEMPNCNVKVLEKYVTLSILKKYKVFKHLSIEVVDGNTLLEYKK